MRLKPFIISDELFLIEYEFRNFRNSLIFCRSISIMVGFKESFLEIPNVVEKALRTADENS